MREEDFLTQIIDLAHIYHWKVAHFRPAMTKHGWRTAVSADGAGFPDCVLLRGDRLIFAEIKSEKGQLTPAQNEWLDALAEVGGATNFQEIQTYVWRPDMLEEIAEILR